MLLGLICPTSGTAVVAEHRPGDPAGLAQIGSLVESPAFYPHLSGRENLPVVATYAGVPQSRVDPALAEVATGSWQAQVRHLVDLESLLHAHQAADRLKEPEERIAGVSHDCAGESSAGAASVSSVGAVRSS